MSGNLTALPLGRAPYIILYMNGNIVHECIGRSTFDSFVTVRLQCIIHIVALVLILLKVQLFTFICKKTL